MSKKSQSQYLSIPFSRDKRQRPPWKQLTERQPIPAKQTHEAWYQKPLKLLFSLLFLYGGFVAFRQFFSSWNLSHKNIPSGDASDWIKEIPSSRYIRQIFHDYASRSHLAGTDTDQDLANYTRDRFIEYGITDTRIEVYWPLLNYPKQRSVVLLDWDQSPIYEARLEEDVLEEETESRSEGRIPTFHAYSADGNVTGPVVYVNYGRRVDFEKLVSEGVNLTGTIALLRSGGSIMSGVKVKLAEEHGCIGALLYSDPFDHGPINKRTPEGKPAESYPLGPWRSRHSVERDTVYSMTDMAGDPLTPGYAAHENATRRTVDETRPTLLGIPSLPISWSDAVPFLRATEGHGYKPDVDWRGGLCNVSYFSGPSAAQVQLVNKNKWETKPIWNVIGRIQGQSEPDKAIILGTHRDAWGYGAVDGSSGTAVMMELVRVLGVLLKRGWRPQRTIIVASWDAEKYGAIGSTEWVEDHMAWLNKEAVAYLHVSMIAGQHFEAQSSPILNRLVYKVTQEVLDPKTGETIYDTWKNRRSPSYLSSITNTAWPSLIDPPQSGSSHVAFFEHLGISSLLIQFNGDYGVSHSNHDSIHWMQTFGDPTFEYHVAMVKIWGLMVLRLSGDSILPMYPVDYTFELSRYLWQISGGLESLKLPVISESIKLLQSVSLQFDEETERYRRQVAVRKHVSHKLKKHIIDANERLIQFERALIDPLGLPGRRWYRHVVYAPDKESGYESQLFPGISEALASHDPNYAREMEDRTAAAINGARHTLEGIYNTGQDEE